VAELQNWNLGGNFLTGYRQGQQRAKGERFNQLASQALQANPREREALQAQATALDADAGFELGERLNKDTDRRQTALYNMAKGFKQIHGQNPQAAAVFYQQQIAPGLQRLGFQVSDQYDEAEVLPVVDQVLAMGGAGGDELKSLRVGGNGNYWAIRGGQLVDTGVQAAPDTELVKGQGGYVNVDLRTNQATPVGIGGAPAAPSAQSPEVTNLQGERGRYSIGADGRPVFIASTTAPNVAQAIQTNAGAFDTQDQVTAPPQVQGAPGAPLLPFREAPQGYNYDAAGNLVTAEGGPAQVQAEQNLVQNERQQRVETSRLVEGPQEVLAAYERVRGAANNPGPAGDLSLVFSFMKMLDPGSVVREGEFANARNAAGVPDRVLNLYNNLREGEILNPKQRGQFLAQANELAEGARRRITNIARNQQEIARQSGLDPFRATGLADFSGVSATTDTTAGGPTGYQIGQIINAGGKRYRITGLSDPNDPDVEEVR